MQESAGEIEPAAEIAAVNGGSSCLRSPRTLPFIRAALTKVNRSVRNFVGEINDPQGQVTYVRSRYYERVRFHAES